MKRTAAVMLLLTAAALSAQDVPKKYSCDGFAEPLRRKSMEVHRGRVLPLKGQLLAADGSNADDKVLRTPPVVSLMLGTADKSEGLEQRDFGKGKSFVYLADPDPHWKFDLGTESMKDNGTYVVTLVSGDAKEYTVDPACRLEFTLMP